MITVTIRKRERGTPFQHEYKVEMPVIPRTTEMLENEVLHFSGSVVSISHYWNEDGKFQVIVDII